MKLKTLSLALLLSTAFAQAASAETWGGKHVSINVQRGSATFEFDCARGSAEGFKADSKGRISAEGTITSFTGMRPSLPAMGHRTHDARFTAKIQGDEMSLTISSEGRSTKYQLRKGAKAELYRCM